MTGEILDFVSDGTFKHIIKISRLLKEYFQVSLSWTLSDSSRQRFNGGQRPRMATCMAENRRASPITLPAAPITTASQLRCSLQGMRVTQSGRSTVLQSCWDDIIMRQVQLKHDHSLPRFIRETDGFLTATWKKNVATHDFWSVANMEPHNDMLRFYHRMTWSSLKVLRMFLRISS
jgi:hypothetical protein